MSLVRSFAYAWRGVRLAVRGRNMRIHLLAAMVVSAASWFYRISGTDLAVLVLCMAAVLAAEVFNTGVEQLCDLSTEVNGLTVPDERIGRIKDLAAGSVLIISVGAAVVAVIIFGPHVL